LGGRIYESNIQNLPQRDRQRLLFDGQHVTEVDYSGCQWRIMYALNGLVFSEDDDPYRLPGFSREAVKAAAQPLGFGKSIKAAIASLKSKQNPALKGLKSSDGKELFDARLLGVDVDALAAAFLDKHRPIKDLLCSPDHALKMQREDAKLMADILKAMMKNKALAYPVHDSLIPVIVITGNSNQCLPNISLLTASSLPHPVLFISVCTASADSFVSQSDTR
jgi:hypothetical protein